MFQSKKGNVTLRVRQFKKVQDVAVSINFPVSNINGVTLVNCCKSARYRCVDDGSHVAAVLYGVCETVKYKLCGSAMESKASRVTNVRCCANNGKFFINWNMKGSLSQVRGALGKALSVIKPSRMANHYNSIMSRLGISKNKESFNWAVDHVIKGIKSGVTCDILGKTAGKYTQDKVDDAVATIEKKLAPGEAKTPKNVSTDNVPCPDDVTELKVSGWKAYLTKQYLESFSGMNQLIVADKKLILDMNPSKYSKKKITFVSKASAFAGKMVKKLDPKNEGKLSKYLAYHGMSSGNMSGSDAVSLFDQSNFNASTLANVLKAAL